MDFTCRQENADTLILEGELRADDPVFRGHFPAVPLLPGVVQVDWAITRQPWYPASTFLRLERLKFVQMTPPDIPLRLTLQHRGGGKVSFHYHCGEHVLSSGVAVFAEAP